MKKNIRIILKTLGETFSWVIRFWNSVCSITSTKVRDKILEKKHQSKRSNMEVVVWWCGMVFSDLKLFFMTCYYDLKHSSKFISEYFRGFRRKSGIWCGFITINQAELKIRILFSKKDSDHLWICVPSSLLFMFMLFLVQKKKLLVSRTVSTDLQ